MRLVTFVHRSGLGRYGEPGLLIGDRVVEIRPLLDETPLSRVDLSALLASGPSALERLSQLVTAAEGDLASIPLEDARLLAPLTPPKIVCVGLNFAPVAKAMSYRPGGGAPIFLKAPSAVIGPDESIILPAAETGPVAAEIELGVIIGRKGRRIPAAEAFEFVAGYTIILDVTANELMDRDAYAFQRPGEEETSHVVFFRAKNFDTFAPIGPALVTRDEVPDETTGALPIQAWADGEQFVAGNTADMILAIPELIEFISSVMTLNPGDLIATGHPGHLKPRFLRAGEKIEARIGGLETLRVHVEQEVLP